LAQGTTIWLTGLPSSGKTTLAESVARSLKQWGTPVEVLDGDEIRRSLSADLGFSAKDRQEHARRVIFLSKLLSRNGVNVIVPLISPYRETRAQARQELERFIEVYVKCSLEECIRRDVKGLYGRAIRGEITEFTGISDPYEPPESPEVIVETDTLSEDECCQLILAAMSELVPDTYSDNGANDQIRHWSARSLSEREST
jgi:adenylylsulfate kinase